MDSQQTFARICPAKGLPLNENPIENPSRLLILCHDHTQKPLQLFDQLAQNDVPAYDKWLQHLTAQKSEEEDLSTYFFPYNSLPSLENSFSNELHGDQQVQDNKKQQNKRRFCGCKMSNCVKNYCQCFQAGKSCSPENCGCQNCENLIENNFNVEKKRILHLKEDIQVKSCTCKRSQCQSNHCECRRFGKECSPQCRCIGCQNKTHQSKARDQGRKLRNLSK